MSFKIKSTFLALSHNSSFKQEELDSLKPLSLTSK